MLKCKKLYSDKYESKKIKFRIADNLHRNGFKTNIKQISAINRIFDICERLGPAMWPIEDPITHEVNTWG